VIEDERVVGAVIAGDIVRARRGVVLACGGFEWDPDLCRAFLRGPIERPVSVSTNTGDGLRMAMRAGAALGNMREAWWYPTVDLPVDGELRPFQIMTHAGWPRCIMVNAQGKRFLNEATNYNASAAAFHVIDPDTMRLVNLPCWVIFDHDHFSRYGFGAVPGAEPVTPGDGGPEWMVSADDLRGLAEKLGIPTGALVSTVERWNSNVAGGRDPDFGRGEHAHDRWWGDPSFDRSTTASTLGPLETAPFHAARVRPGTIGTKGGPRTNAGAQVLDLGGEPIPGLFAAGNVMASCMGPGYGGAGGTLGPAIVFGYLAGRTAATAGQPVTAVAG
jgi:3-oxosteroid 1-dehydrogenase